MVPECQITNKVNKERDKKLCKIDVYGKIIKLLDWLRGKSARQWMTREQTSRLVCGWGMIKSGPVFCSLAHDLIHTKYGRFSRHVVTWNLDCDVSTVSGGGKHKSRFLAVYYVFNANISFTFQAIKNLSAHPAYLYFGPFFGDFLIYLEINRFSERISKIYGNRKFWRFGVVLKLKFEV